MVFEALWHPVVLGVHLNTSVTPQKPWVHHIGMKDSNGTKVPTVSSAQWRFVATIPVGPLFNHPTTYRPLSTVAVSDSMLRTLPLKFGTTPKIKQRPSCKNKCICS